MTDLLNYFQFFTLINQGTINIPKVKYLSTYVFSSLN